MKTVTEFSGSTLKSAAAAKAKLVGEGVAPEQMAERLGAEVNVTGDRLARLMEALEAAGDQVERVRLMRVFAATDEPKGAKKIGEFNYLIDLQPSAAPGGRDRDRGRGGGRDRARGGGGGLGGVPGAGVGGGKGGHGPIGRDGLPKEDRGALQTAGAGWTLTRDPSAPLHDKRRGKPGGPKRGKPGDRRGPGGPGGDRRGPGGPRGPGAPGADARGPRGPRPDRPHGPRPDRPQGPRPPGAPGMRPQGPRPPGQPGQPGAPGQSAEAGAPGGPAGEGRRRRRRGGRGRGGPFALQPSTAPGAAAALGIPTASTTGIDPNAPQAPPGPPGLPGQKRRRRRGGRGRGPGGQGPRPEGVAAGTPPTGAPVEPPTGAPVEPSTGAPVQPATAAPAEPTAQRPPEQPSAPRHVPAEANGNVRPPEAPPPIGADEAAPEPGNER